MVLCDIYTLELEIEVTCGFREQTKLGVRGRPQAQADHQPLLHFFWHVMGRR